jgi:hypothetical protein
MYRLLSSNASSVTRSSITSVRTAHITPLVARDIPPSRVAKGTRGLGILPIVSTPAASDSALPTPPPADVFPPRLA